MVPRRQAPPGDAPSRWLMSTSHLPGPQELPPHAPWRPLTSAVTATNAEPVLLAASPCSLLRARVRPCELVFAPVSSCSRMRARSPGARLFARARAAEPDAAQARPMRRGLEEGRACSPSGEPTRPRGASCADLVNGLSEGELAPQRRRKITRRGAGSPGAAQARPARRKLARCDARPVAAVEHPLTASPRIRRRAGSPMVRSYITGKPAHPRLPDHALH